MNIERIFKAYQRDDLKAIYKTKFDNEKIPITREASLPRF